MEDPEEHDENMPQLEADAVVPRQPASTGEGLDASNCVVCLEILSSDVVVCANSDAFSGPYYLLTYAARTDIAMLWPRLSFGVVR